MIKMFNYEITSVAGRYKSRKRRGRGGSRGKTSGRGCNGQNSRSGARSVSLAEGGQMPLFRRLPKRGFNNYKFRLGYEVVNVSQLDRFDEGSNIGARELSGAGLIDSPGEKVKILGDGELTKKLQVKANKFSKTAERKIVALGGSAEVV